MNLNNKTKEEQLAARDKFLVMLFLDGLHDQHKGMVNDLHLAYADGEDKYPKTIDDAVNWFEHKVKNTKRANHWSHAQIDDDVSEDEPNTDEETEE